MESLGSTPSLEASQSAVPAGGLPAIGRRKKWLPGLLMALGLTGCFSGEIRPEASDHTVRTADPEDEIDEESPEDSELEQRRRDRRDDQRLERRGF